jgi:hypothetical protein
MTESESEFDRGHLAGEIAARLEGHDRHFSTINGSLERIAANLEKQTLAIQRLGDQAESAAKTVITTASALKDAEAARREKSNQSWTPVAKGLAILGSAVAVIGLIVTIVLATR